MDYLVAFMEYHEALWNNKKLDGIPSSFYGIPGNSCDIQKAPWNRNQLVWNIKELLLNTKKWNTKKI